MKVIRNGEIIEEMEACVPIFNKSAFFDFAVYSNIKVIQGKMFVPEMEIEGLFESAEIIGLEHDFESGDVLDWMEQLIRINKLKDSLVRLMLLGSDGEKSPELWLFAVGLTFYPRKFYHRGIKVITYPGERFVPRAKAKNLLLNYVAYREVVDNDAIEALLIDRDGHIREGTRSSFFAFRGKTLYLPPREEVLAGVTRKIIVDLVIDKYKIFEERIPLKDLKKFDEAFLSATTMKVMPIRQVDGKILSDKVGPHTADIQRLFDGFSKKALNEDQNFRNAR